jgi:tRNA (cmo5U34)-methyltransferase
MSYRFQPEGYLEEIREDIPRYDELQREVARATEGVEAARILELGTGTGETARLVLAGHRNATLVGIDVSAEMLAAAESSLPPGQVEDLRVLDLADVLPGGPFDLVCSALAVHHLDGPAKADLFRRVAAELRSGGRFVLGDVVVPERPEDAEIPLTEGFDLPDPVDALLEWLRQAGLHARLAWTCKDLAVLVADKPSS